MTLYSRKHNNSLTKFAKNLRKSMTDEERRLWFCFLRDYPVRFLRQKVIDSYIADFYCSKAKLIIEIDGSQHFDDENIESDAQHAEQHAHDHFPRVFTRGTHDPSHRTHVTLPPHFSPCFRGAPGIWPPHPLEGRALQRCHSPPGKSRRKAGAPIAAPHRHFSIMVNDTRHFWKCQGMKGVIFRNYSTTFSVFVYILAIILPNFSQINRNYRINPLGLF